MPASTVKIPYIQRIRSLDGKVRLYFRKGDHREGPLSAPDGSDELREEVEAIVKKLTALELPRLRGLFTAWAGQVSS